MTENQSLEGSRNDASQPDTGDQDTAAARSWGSRLRPLLVPLGAYVVARFVTLVAFATADLINTKLDLGGILSKWDGRWYISIMEGGYDIPSTAAPLAKANVAFFPLFPTVGGWISDVTGLSALAAGVALSVVAGAGAVILLWALTRMLLGERVADRAALLLAFFPTSFVFLQPYSEGVAFCCALVCLIGLLRRQWWLAGIAAALATAARPPAVVLCLCCAWEAARAIRERGEWRSLVAPALSPLGLLAYFGFLWSQFGAPDLWLRVEREGWHHRFDFGASTLEAIGTTFTDPTSSPKVIWSTVALLFAIIAVVMMIRWKPPSVLWVYTVGILLISFGSETVLSRPRYMMGVFPLLIGMARVVKGRAFSVALATSGACLACAAVLASTTQFFIP